MDIISACAILVTVAILFKLFFPGIGHRNNHIDMKLETPKEHSFESSDDELDSPENRPLGKFVQGQFLDHLDKAVRGFLEEGAVSPGILRKYVGVVGTQASGYMDRLEYIGIISPPGPSGDRKLLISKEEYEKVLHKKILSYASDPQFEKMQQILKRLSADIYLLHTKSLDEVDEMEGSEFEYWCADLLKQLGYKDVEVTQASGDQGVDIIAKKDDVSYGFQCKRHSQDQGNTPIQEIYAGIRLRNLHVGVVITNQYFTKGAQELAQATNILLWDREKLATFLKILSDGQQI